MSEYKFKTQPFKHQLEALAKSANKKNFAYFMEMGCFDGETEFLTQRGWIRFEDFNLETWKRPLLVAQAIPESKDLKDWSFEFVEPLAYINKQDINWITFSARNIGSTLSTDIVVTEDHTFPCRYTWWSGRHTDKERGITRSQHNNKYEQIFENVSAKYLHQTLHKDPKREPLLGTGELQLGLPGVCSKGLRGFDSEYYQENELNQLNEWEIRFMVAVAADGTYPNRNNKVDFYFEKMRKVERLRFVAARAGIPMAYETTTKNGKTIHIFHAIAPARYKEFTSEWYNLPGKALCWIAEEVWYWDGYIGPAESRFYTKSKESADFIQYALMASGWMSRIAFEMSKGIWSVSGKYRNCRNMGVTPMNTWVDDRSKRSRDVPTIVTDTCQYLAESSAQRKPKQAYCFRVPSGFLVMRRNNRIFIAGNSGKTKVMIDNIAVLHNAGHITGALVLAPKGVYRNWSEKEIPAHLPDEVNREVLVWRSEATDNAKNKLLKQIEEWDGKTLQILVFNIESLISQKGKNVLQAFIKKHNSNIFALVDESTCIKNHKAKRTKEALAVGKACKVRRIATGSPVTNSPLDLFSQCAFLDPALLGCGSFYAFKNTYANIEKVQNRQGQHYEKILSYKNLDKLSSLLDKFSFRVTKKDCLDLPDKIYVTRDVDLTPEQCKVYKEMQDYQFALLKDKDEFKEMSAQVVLTKLLRLHQVLCGTFTSDDGTTTRLPNNRLDTLAEVLEETQGKVIIWATYLADIEAIKELLTQKFGAESFVTYYGETKSEDRVKAIELFQDESSPVRFFLGNVQTAGRGITLTAASTVVYYSNNFSLELRQQSEDRAHRLGQKNKVTYVDLVVRGSLDEKIIKSLVEKRNIANEILKDDLDSWISLQTTQ